jgi:hypothetical protein
MRNFIKKMIMMAVVALAMLFGFTAPAVAQKSKLSPATRMIIADRDGKISIEKANAFAKGHQPTKTQTLSVNGKTEKFSIPEAFNGSMPFVEPFTVDGVKMAQCWIKMTDNNYSAIEALGVKIQAKFDGLVTANIPVSALEKVAALKNVQKVSVANKVEKYTYYGREATNVDDVLNFTADAQAAGLLQAYDGTGVVIGIIDTGIQFNHQMFKDENGNTRIKKAIVYDTDAEELVEYDTQSAIEALTYDTNSSYHGSHTSSIAGGSNFTFNGYYYNNSTSSYVNGSRVYGGMAPKADLVLCGLAGELSDANIGACVQKISQYADQVGKPCVISISLGSQAGPHDGTGNLSDVFAQYMSGPGKVIVKAAGNDGDEDIYLYKSATKANPAMSVLNLTYYDGYTSGSYTLNNYFLYGQDLVYARTPGVDLAAKFYVIDTSTNTIVWVSDEMTSDTQWSVNSDETDPDATYSSDLAQYFSSASDNGGYLCAFFDTDPETGKKYIYTNVFYLAAEDYTQSGTTITGKYKIGVSYYPKNNGVTVDLDGWGLNYTYFEGATATYNGSTYTFVAGNNLCSISDDGTFPTVIPIGSYCSMKSWAASNGSGYAINGTLSDIASSSGYQAEGSGPLGTKLPWITAPGQMIVAAYNSGWVANNSTSTYLLYQYDSTNPLGVASGTSMASPCAGGIVALWLQVDPTLTLQDVKTLMQETAIKDSYVTGTNATQFGNGKIDALAGIQALLPDGPRIGATPQTVTMSTTVGNSATKTVSVRGANLTTRVNFTLSDANGVFSIDKQYVTRDKAQSTEGAEFTITFTPTVEGTYTATVTLSSTGAEDVIVTINGEATEAGGTASDAYLNIAKYATIDEAGWNTSLVNKLYDYKEYETDECAWLTLPAYSAVVGAKYSKTSSNFGSGNPQKWMATGVSNSNQIGNTTWNTTDVLLGSSNYFTSTTARAVGTNSNSSTSEKTVTFYVTNTTAVKLYCSQRSTSTTYPTTLSVYVCTENSDGTLNAASSATASTSRTQRGAESISITGLDETKIYKVVASQARGYLYEIAFKTPLKKGAITADPTSLTFETFVGESVTKTFHVTGTSLKNKPISVTVTNGSNVYSVDKNSITATEAENGGVDVTVTFTPTTADENITGTVTLSSQGAKDDVTVALNGTARARSLIADPTELTFKCLKGQTDSKTFDVLGEYLKEGVSLTLADDNGVFSIDKTSLTKAEAEDGASVTVTFSPTVNGDYTGTVTLSSDGVEDVIVYLTATSYPDYFTVNISQYGLTTLYVDFPLVIPYDTYDPDLLGVWYVNSADGKEVRLAEVFDYIPANTGVIVQGNEGSYDFPRYQGTVDPIEGNLLYGSLERTTPDNALKAANASSTSIVMTLGMGKSMVGFYKYTGKYLNANKAYLIYDKGEQSNVNSLAIGGIGGDFTGINDINARFDEGAWYTLQGIRLNGKPLQRGVYLHNGKAVVVK